MNPTLNKGRSVSIATICIEDLSREMQLKMGGENCFDSKGCPLGNISCVGDLFVHIANPCYSHDKIQPMSNVWFMPLVVEGVEDKIKEDIIKEVSDNYTNEVVFLFNIIDEATSDYDSMRDIRDMINKCLIKNGEPLKH